MGLRFVGKDPESGDHGCPAVWVDDDRRLLIQGAEADADTLTASATDTPRAANETLIILEPRMIPLLKEAIRVAESQ